MNTVDAAAQLTAKFGRYFSDMAEQRFATQNSADQEFTIGKRAPNECRGAVLDLDGTVLLPNGSIPKYAHRLLSDMHKSDLPVVLASARPARSIFAIQEQLGLSGPVVALNGSWAGTRSVELVSETVPQYAVKKILDLLDHHPSLEWNIYTRDHWFVGDNATDAVRHESKMVGFPPDGTTDPIAAHKFLICGDPKKIDTIRVEIRALCLPVSASVSNPNFLEIVPVGVSKSSALKAILHHYERRLDEMIAIGDGENDIEMIRDAGHGIAMGSCAEKLRAASDAVTSSNAQYGALIALFNAFADRL